MPLLRHCRRLTAHPPGGNSAAGHLPQATTPE